MNVQVVCYGDFRGNRPWRQGPRIALVTQIFRPHAGARALEVPGHHRLLRGRGVSSRYEKAPESPRWAAM